MSLSDGGEGTEWYMAVGYVTVWRWWGHRVVYGGGVCHCLTVVRAPSGIWRWGMSLSDGGEGTEWYMAVGCGTVGEEYKVVCFIVYFFSCTGYWWWWWVEISFCRQAGGLLPWVLTILDGPADEESQRYGCWLCWTCVALTVLFYTSIPLPLPPPPPPPPLNSGKQPVCSHFTKLSFRLKGMPKAIIARVSGQR